MSNDSHLKELSRFMGLDEKALSAVRGLKPYVDVQAAADDLYDTIAATPEFPKGTADQLRASKINRVAQWNRLLSAEYGPEYSEGAMNMGRLYAKTGVELRWCIGGYAIMLDHLIRAAVEQARPKGMFASRSREVSDGLADAIVGLVKVALLDIDLATVGNLDESSLAARAEEAEKRVALDKMAGTMTGALQRLAGGDLTAVVGEEMPNQFEAIKTDFNDAVGKLRDMVAALSTTAETITVGSDEIANATDDLSRRTEQQAASLEETAAALDEITATVSRTASGANQASEVVSVAKREAEHSGGVVGQAVSAMGEIEKSSQQIAQIIGVIDEIAFQTNLLALNAGVEAARAGDAGRGFAVVAQEVRALAQRSAEAAKEIKSLISSSSAQVVSGVDLVGQTGEALRRIVGRVAEIDTLVSAIAASAKEQAQGLAEVNSAINQMDQVTQQNAAMVEETTAASRSLRAETSELSRLANGFHIGREHSRNVAVPALKTMGGRGVSAARRPDPRAQDASWEEF
jgi:methyl-accepting chemotaxis protein